MSGCVIANTPVCVDYWRGDGLRRASIFLLSHAHADHTAGLTSSWTRPIYCSNFTADYVSQVLGISPVVFCPLELDTQHVISLDGDCGLETMTLTLVDANHCPGAVSFIMEGYFGVIVYMGDVRYDGDTDEIPSALHSIVGRLDVLYLDNTYNDPSCQFPTRLSCTAQMLDVISQYPAHDILIATRRLGKEDLFAKVAAATKEWVSVTEEMYETTKTLGISDYFTTDWRQCRIRTRPLYSINDQTLRRLNNDTPTVAIIPSAIFTGRRSKVSSEFIHVIPYSDHSSFDELRRLVHLLRPKRIVPIVKQNIADTAHNRSDMSYFDDLLNVKAANTVAAPMPCSILDNLSERCSSSTIKSLKRRSLNGHVRKRHKPCGVIFHDSLCDTS